MKKIKKFMPLVYVCSPFAGDTHKNILSARKYSRFVVNEGYIPITPHLLFPQFLDDNIPKDRKLGLKFGNVLMDKCSEVWVFGEHISKGMECEIKRAIKRKYKIRYFSEELKEVEGGAETKNCIWK